MLCNVARFLTRTTDVPPLAPSRKDSQAARYLGSLQNFSSRMVFNEIQKEDGWSCYNLSTKTTRIR